MGLHLSLVNFDNLFYQQSTKAPVIANDYMAASKEEKAAFNQLIYTKYTTDLLSNLPKCECSDLTGEHLLGQMCSKCGTTVQSPLEQTLEPLVWLRAPKGVEKFINPLVWTMLTKRFTVKNFKIIEWLCGEPLAANARIPAYVDKLQEMKFTRGYNQFVQNFDAILNRLFEMRELKNQKQRKKGLEPLQQLIMQQRDCVFSQYLPLPNRSLFVLQELPVGTFFDPTLTGALDAAHTLAGIDTPLSPHQQRAKENRTVAVIALLADFNDELAKNFLGGKPGMFRKHLAGTRAHFSFRAVITSLTDAHDYREIHIPWGVGISVLRIHLINKLLRRGMGVNESVSFLNEYAQKYNPTIDELFKELIAECPYIGIPVVYQRNPSLERASAQALFITVVKPDVDDPTVSLSILAVVGFNADGNFV